MSVPLTNATPVLRVADYARAKAFYMDVLGFAQVNEAGDPVPGFGIFVSGGARVFLHGWDGAEAAYDGWRAWFNVEDLDGFVAQMQAHGQAFAGPKTTDYGMREIEVTDPDGNVLCFGTDA